MKSYLTGNALAGCDRGDGVGVARVLSFYLASESGVWIATARRDSLATEETYSNVQFYERLDLVDGATWPLARQASNAARVCEHVEIERSADDHARLQPRAIWRQNGSPPPKSAKLSARCLHWRSQGSTRMNTE